jgi:hypothetical protein
LCINRLPGQKKCCDIELRFIKTPSEFEDLLVIGRLFEARLRLCIATRPLHLELDDESQIREERGVVELLELEAQAHPQHPPEAGQPF